MSKTSSQGQKVQNTLTNSDKEVLISSVSKYALAMDVPMSADRISILVSDIEEVFGRDKLEKVLTVIKKGRQGYYGDNYRSLNMVLIQKWYKEEYRQSPISVSMKEY